MSIKKKFIDLTNKGFTYAFSLCGRFNKKWEHQNSKVLISGVPRGGTTWLAEVLNNESDTILLWEPFRPFRLYEQNLRDFSNRLGWFPFIPVENDWKKGGKVVKDIFSLKNINYKSLLQHNSYKKVIHAKFVIIKCVTANMLLPYINKHTNMRTILLLRHPCSVIASQLKQGSFKVAHEEAQKFFDPKFMHRDFFRKYQTVFEELRSNEELLSFIWCLQNLIPLEFGNSKFRMVLYYEELLNDHKQFENVFKFIQREMPENLNIQKASRTSVDFNLEKNIQLQKWKEVLSKQQVDDILSVLYRLGIDIYTDDLLPNKLSKYYVG